VPPILLTLMEAFRGFFTAPVFDHVLVLVTGAVLTPGKRTVSAVLRIMGLGQAGGFALYHHVLSQARWDSRAIACKLLAMILDRFLPAGPVIIGIDDTIERRWGQKIAARGIYRDPVRSSHGHFVKASGLRWLSFMAMIPLPLAQRRWALPFLTLLAPSQRHDDTKGKRHKSLVDWARQGILQIKRWLPGRLIITVADSSFAAIELIAAVRRHVWRLRRFCHRRCPLSRVRMASRRGIPGTVAVRRVAGTGSAVICARRSWPAFRRLASLRRTTRAIWFPPASVAVRALSSGWH
jgi:DDE superfamily endonuclease